MSIQTQYIMFGDGSLGIANYPTVWDINYTDLGACRNGRLGISYNKKILSCGNLLVPIGGVINGIYAELEVDLLESTIDNFARVLGITPQMVGTINTIKIGYISELSKYYYIRYVVSYNNDSGTTRQLTLYLHKCVAEGNLELNFARKNELSYKVKFIACADSAHSDELGTLKFEGEA